MQSGCRCLERGRRQGALSRKFALFIRADKWGPIALGKTCRCPTPCDPIITHKDELDLEMATALTRLKPDIVGKDYLVPGTVNRKVWQRGLRSERPAIRDAMEYLADCESVLTLKLYRGGRGVRSPLDRLGDDKGSVKAASFAPSTGHTPV